MISALVAVIALVTAVFAVSTSAASLPFSDIKEKAWYYDAVKEAYEKKFMEGMPNGRFAPNESVTRAQYVTILARLCDAKTDTDNDFKDVGAKKWYAAAVSWASSAGIVTGYEDNTFRGDNPITRQELMVMTVRYLDYIWVEPASADNAVASFTDAKKIGKWAREYVDEVRRIGLVEGDEAGRFNPEKTATRAEIATMTVRIANMLDEYDKAPTIGDVSLDKFTVYSDVFSETQLNETVSAVNEATSAQLVAGTKNSEHSIIFGVDDELRMLEYSLKEDGGNLYINVSTKFALSYMPRIFKDAASLREHFNIPSGYSCRGVYALDSATDAGDISFVCETDKNPLSYSLGDKVTFRISMISEDRLVSSPQIHYMYIDDAKYTREATIAGHTGQFVVTFDGMEKPGCGYLMGYAANRKGEKISSIETELSAGVAFDFNNIKAAMEKPDDFDTFWDAKIAELMKVEPTALVYKECGVCHANGFKTYYAEVQSLGTVATVHIAYPENAKSTSLPISVTYFGYGAPSSNGAIYDSNAITVSVNRNEVKDHMSSDYYTQHAKDIEGWCFDNPTREDSYFIGMIMRDIQAIRFTEKEFGEYWNGHDIYVAGGSMGGFQSVAVAGLYDHVTMCSPNVPWMSDVGGYKTGRVHGSFFPDYSEGSRYYDSSYFAERFNGVVNLYAGLGDDTCRAVSTIALYNAFKCEKTGAFSQCATHGAGGGPYNKTYSVSSAKPEFAVDDVQIKDNGSAVKGPDYSANRKLTASEEAMKAAVSQYSSKVKWITETFGTSDTITAEALENLIKNALVTKCGLSDEYTIVVDDDSLAKVRSNYSDFVSSGDYFLTVSYTVTDKNGGYYDGEARMLLTKNV